MLQRFELQSTFRRSLVNDSQRNDGQLSVSTTVTQWRLLLRQSRTLLRHCSIFANNVEATFDFVNENGHNVERVLR